MTSNITKMIIMLRLNKLLSLGAVFQLEISIDLDQIIISCEEIHNDIEQALLKGIYHIVG